MRIGKPESDEKGFVRFGDIGIGCCFREYDDWNSDEPVYMRTNGFSVYIEVSVKPSSLNIFIIF